MRLLRNHVREKENGVKIQTVEGKKKDHPQDTSLILYPGNIFQTEAKDIPFRRTKLDGLVSQQPAQQQVLKEWVTNKGLLVQPRNLAQYCNNLIGE